MANSIAGTIGKSILLILLIAALIIGGIIWFDFLGVLDRGDTLNYITERIGLSTPEPVEEDSNSIYLLDAVRLVKEKEAIQRREVALESREEQLKLEEAKVKQVAEELKEKENSIIDKENSLNEALTRYEDEEQNLETTVKYLASMPPKRVVEIMDNYPILKVVDTLRKEDEIAKNDNRVSNSAIWLQFMEPDRAASVQDMMIKKPVNKS